MLHSTTASGQKECVFHSSPHPPGVINIAMTSAISLSVQAHLSEDSSKSSEEPQDGT